MGHHKVARETAEAGLMRTIGALAVILPSVALIQVLANSVDYRMPAVVIAAWLAVFGVVAWLLPRLRMGGLTVGEAVAAILIAVAVVAVSGVMHRAHGAPGRADLAVLGTVWLLALVTMSRSLQVCILGALLVFAVHGVLLIRCSGLNPLSLSEIEASGYVLSAVLIVFTTLRLTLAMHVSVAARRASLASRLAAERATATAVQQERESRLTVLEKKALPLLRGIADGSLDPTAGDVREQCARQAAVLRHSLTGGASGDRELVTVLEPALRSARARGLLVTVQLIGNPGTPQPLVACSLLATVDAVLSELPPHQVTLTVLTAGEEAELYMTFSVPLRSRPDLTRFGAGLPAAVGWHATISESETGVSEAETSSGCLEITWRKSGAV